MATTRAVPKDSRNDEQFGERKEILDPIYGSMDFHPALVKIIDTPEFQRLRDIKKLGGTCYVYPGGVHTQFDHSFGTAYLCQKQMRTLQKKYKWITDKDVLCVCIAGLCHELGHGPFSHVYQNQFLQGMKGEEWDYKTASAKIFDKILDREKVASLLRKYDIGQKESDFIKEAMQGRVPDDKTKDRYLYEIVKNERNGIDCHEIDSALRDGFFVGRKCHFNYERYFKNSRIIKVENEKRLCIRFKLQFELYEFFHAIWSLKHCVYFHKTTSIIEIMIADAFANVDSKYGISEARQDPEQLLSLSDNLIYRIMNEKGNDSDDEIKAKHILRRIQRRDLYQFCGQTNIKKKTVTRRHSLDEQPAESPCYPTSYKDKIKFADAVAEGIANQSDKLSKGDMFIDIVDVVFGIGKGDPLKSMDFVNKEDQLVKPTMKESLSEQLPVTFKDQYIRVYARERKNKDDIIRKFYSWCLENNYDIPEYTDKQRIAVENEDPLVPAMNSNI